MKRTVQVVLVLILMSCNKSEEAPKTRTFFFEVFNADEPTVNGLHPPVIGATVKVYDSKDSWLNNVAPIKTFTTNSKGQIESFDKFTDVNLIYVEYGLLNNWPETLTTLLFDDPGFPGSLQGSALVRESFLPLFESVNDKSFVLSDVLQNNVSIFGSVSACSKDNFIKLQKNAKLFYSEGATVCSGNAATQEFSMLGIVGKKQSTPVTINSTSLHEFPVSWPEANNKIYVNMNYTQVWTKVTIGSSVVVSIYTREL